jgi:uncharacterized protein (TIGR02466 family)
MAENSILVTSGFATPFGMLRLQDCESLNNELKTLFLEREKEGSKWQEEYPTATLKVETFESNFELFNWPEACIQKLKKFVFQALGQVIMQVNGNPIQDLNRLNIFNHAWFHITRSGGYMGTHNHPMASWSGIYCVDDGGDDPGNPDSGATRFYDPRNSVNMYMDAGNNHWVSPYVPGVRSYKVRAGQLVIFPSFLMHDVAPFSGTGTRIVVAFNAWIKDPAANPRG